MPRAKKTDENEGDEKVVKQLARRNLSRRNSVTLSRGNWGHFFTLSTAPAEDGDEWRNLNLSKEEMAMLLFQGQELLRESEEIAKTEPKREYIPRE